MVNRNDVINSNGVEYLFDQETTLFRYWFYPVIKRIKFQEKYFCKNSIQPLSGWLWNYFVPRVETRGYSNYSPSGLCIFNQRISCQQLDAFPRWFIMALIYFNCGNWMYIFILFQSKFAAKILFSKSGGLDINSHGF